MIASGDHGEVMASECGKRRCVKKIVKFSTNMDRDAFDREIHVSRLAGKAGIAPLVTKSYSNRAVGEVEMERFDYTLWDIFTNKEVQDLVEYDKRVVGLLEALLHMGYVHNDSHPENFGVFDLGCEHRVVIFDFGYAVPYSGDAMQALLAQLYIYAERFIHKYGDDYVNDAYLMDVIYAIRQNTYVFGSHIDFISKPILKNNARCFKRQRVN